MSKTLHERYHFLEPLKLWLIHELKPKTQRQKWAISWALSVNSDISKNTEVYFFRSGKIGILCHSQRSILEIEERKSELLCRLQENAQYFELEKPIDIQIVIGELIKEKIPEFEKVEELSESQKTILNALRDPCLQSCFRKMLQKNRKSSRPESISVDG